VAAKRKQSGHEETRDPGAVALKNGEQEVLERGRSGLIALLCRVFLLYAVLLAFGADGIAQQGSSLTFEVDSKRGWQPTSLVVSAGQQLTFSAVGKWSVDARNFSFVGPQGYTWQEDERIFKGAKSTPPSLTACS
jgi:hypothetical protein